MALTRDFKLDADGEWVVENGDFVTVADADAVPQGIRIRLGMFLGECYLDESIGVDYIGTILVKNPDPLVVREELRRGIAATPDVTDVIGAQLQLDSATREANIDYTVDTVYSETPFNSSAQVEVP